MSAPITQTQNSARPALRHALIRSVVAVGVLGAGIGAVRGLETMLNAVFDKPPAPLSKPLPEMRRELGTPVRYVATGLDEVMNPEMVETLGTTDYLVRQYHDTTVAADVPGAFVNLNVNYYATGTSTPHVPEICWAGSGMEEAPGSRALFVVPGVKRKDGRRVDLTMRMISFMPPGGAAATDAGEPRYCNVAYVFQVNGEYVAGTQEVTSRFWKAAYRYAYHSKIEVTPMNAGNGGGSGVLICTPAQAQKMVGDFIREALPEVEACLPDPAILTQAGADPGVKGTEVK